MREIVRATWLPARSRASNDGSTSAVQGVVRSLILASTSASIAELTWARDGFGETGAFVRFGLGGLLGLFVGGIDFREFAVVEFFQPGGKPGELEFEFFLPLAHAGFPLAVGFTERLAQALAFRGLFALDLRIHRGEAVGGFLFRGSFQDPGARRAIRTRGGWFPSDKMKPNTQTTSNTPSEMTKRGQNRLEAGTAGAEGQPKVGAGDDDGEQPERDEAEEFRQRQLVRRLSGFTGLLEFFEQGLPQFFGRAGAVHVRARFAFSVETVRQQRLIGPERREHGFPQFPAGGAVAGNEGLKRLMLFLRLLQFLLAGLAVAHDRSLHLADPAVFHVLDALGECAAAVVIGLMDSRAAGFGGGLCGIDFLLADGGQFVNPACEFLRIRLLALGGFPADDRTAARRGS